MVLEICPLTRMMLGIYPSGGGSHSVDAIKWKFGIYQAKVVILHSSFRFKIKRIVYFQILV